MNMKNLIGSCVVWIVVSSSVMAQTNSASVAGDSGQTVETLICLRHAEKPKGGLGQLTPRGLNRSLALPDVLLTRYGRPDFIFVPNPTEKVDDDRYYYVRPIATIEPTAIRCGLPLNTQFGYRETKEMEAELQKTQYANSTVFIVWEHGALTKFARDIYKHNGGDPAKVPVWTGNDYDSIYVFKIVSRAGKKSISFQLEHEGLDNMSDDFPQPAKKNSNH